MQFLYRFEAMSTPCELTLFTSKKSRADRVAHLVVQEAKRLEKKYNYFNPNSYISKINQRVVKDLDYESKNILQRAKLYYKDTGGIFDITLATIKDLFIKERTLYALQKEQKSLISYIGCDHFEIKRDKILFDNKFTKIDLGGFVKEYAVDRASDIVRKNRVDSALINFGGDIFAIGRKPNAERFKVGIKDPKKKDRYIEFVEIEDQALTTSASYERNYKIEDQEFSHILSIKNSKTKTLSATVISHNCVESGVYSTSLMIDPTIKTKNRVILI